jgi:glucose dehydrogenase
MVRKIAILVVASLLAGFVWLNWSALSALTPISLGWRTVHAPLGLVLLVPLLVSLAILAQAPPPAVPRPFTPVTQKMLENPSPDDWLMFSRTYDAQRYSPLKQITTANVSSLRLKWIFPIPHFGLEVTPLAADGVLYVTGPNQVFALDALTGDPDPEGAHA